jgi:predicted AlkP superfamily phosphohydrolase/phosphomutase
VTHERGGRLAGRAAVWLLAAVAICGTLAACGGDWFSTSGKQLVVIGIDGMDPNLLEQFVAEGKMPHFAELMKDGTFRRLGTSNPPQSPVAWSSFITGLNPGGHAVFDFLHRDPAHYAPVSSTQTTPPVDEWNLPGKYKVPSPFAEEPEPIRQGKPFWDMLADAGVQAQIYRIPAAYPIQDTPQMTMSDMGTPDLQGGIDGTYFYYSEEIPEKLLDEKLKMQQVLVDDNRVYASIPGPPNAFEEDNPHTRAPFAVYLDPDEDVSLIEIDGGDSLVLAEGNWSDWHEVVFEMAFGQTVSGITRFYLKEARPVFRLYVAPVQIDPLAPAFPISTPDDAVVDMAEEIGRFYTQGLAEDTIALQDGVLDDGEFLDQCNLVTDERMLMLDYALDRFDDGLLFFYFSTIDLRCHMMYRHITEGHPARVEAEVAQYKDAIEAAYRKVDAALGHLRERIGDADLIVLSDHGFSPFVRKVNLNRWLQNEGFLHVDDEGATDWSRTRAYAVGFNGIYFNLVGREAEGIVTESERKALGRDISDRLLALRDDEWEKGSQPVLRMYPREDIYTGEYVSLAPDLVVGYNRGYGASNPTALGAAPKKDQPVVEDNKGKWSGNHLMAPEVVPGVLVTSLPITSESPWLGDVTATILEYFGVQIPADLAGSPIQ